ncbi:MAG: DUF1310 domain-containing protein [Streptococcaceae bacterium]|jgi:ABC-type Na+ efflux pump permease subunit|nr:DUF1310 domain-containing protein [Streptococcaceae bacterium]
MSKRKKWIIGIFVLIIVLIAGYGGKIYMDNQELNNEMVEVVKSQEAKEVFEEGLKNLDSKALTNEGVIKSYEIDYDSIKHNPMGGVNVTIIINKDKDLTLEYDLDKYSKGLESGGVVISEKLVELIESKGE